ncbi:MAG: hypothetical protein MUP24_02645 [Gillisia sp.]|nr:hypothetical protein [Gillisia sp.]
MKNDLAEVDIFPKDKIGAFSLFGKNIFNDLSPSIEDGYLVIKDRKHQAIAGLPLEGGQFLNFGLSNLVQFSYVCRWFFF